MRWALLVAIPYVFVLVLAALSDAPLARMSGSGATCFALFSDEASARAMGEVAVH